MAKVVAVNTSDKKGVVKKRVEKALVKEGYGLEGDAHGGDWHRQVSLLGIESYRHMRRLAKEELCPGIFAENITTEGIELHTIPVGTKLRLGEAVLEITQIGKACHHGCEIFKKVGDCVMPREGVFARVVQGGLVKTGDPIEKMASEVPS